MGYLRNAITIAAPRDEVFRITNDIRGWPDLFSEYAAAEVIEETPEAVTFRLTTHPDQDGKQWSWIAHRSIDHARYKTYSEREPDSGPFAHMVIRWWYDRLDDTQTVMTWEQEFTLRSSADVTEEQATAYLNSQTHIQQGVIKARIEQRTGSEPQSQSYRGIIVGRYHAGTEADIAEAFRRSDATDLPYLLHVRSRHVWLHGDIYIHFVEAGAPLREIISGYAQHPGFKQVKADLDALVSPLSPELAPGVAREIYSWTPDQASRPAEVAARPVARAAAGGE